MGEELSGWHIGRHVHDRGTKAEQRPEGSSWCGAGALQAHEYGALRTATLTVATAMPTGPSFQNIWSRTFALGEEQRTPQLTHLDEERMAAAIAAVRGDGRLSTSMIGRLRRRFGASCA